MSTTRPIIALDANVDDVLWLASSEHQDLPKFAAWLESHFFSPQ